MARHTMLFDTQKITLNVIKCSFIKWAKKMMPNHEENSVRICFLNVFKKQNNKKKIKFIHEENLARQSSPCSLAKFPNTSF
jgi:hypothetical protein